MSYRKAEKILPIEIIVVEELSLWTHMKSHITIIAELDLKHRDMAMHIKKF